MAAVTIQSDFGAQENKICYCFHFSPSVCHEVMGPDAMIFVFLSLSLKPAFSLSSFTLINRLLVLLHFLPLEWVSALLGSERVPLKSDSAAYRLHFQAGDRRWLPRNGIFCLYPQGLAHSKCSINICWIKERERERSWMCMFIKQHVKFSVRFLASNWQIIIPTICQTLWQTLGRNYFMNDDGSYHWHQNI